MKNRAFTDVPYMEHSDFSISTHPRPLMAPDGPRYMLIIVVGSFCGWCTKASPAYAKAASHLRSVGNVIPVALMIDGDEPGEVSLRESGVYQAFLDHHRIKSGGVPAYYLYDRDQDVLHEHSAGRSVEELITFCNSKTE